MELISERVRHQTTKPSDYVVTITMIVFPPPKSTPHKHSEGHGFPPARHPSVVGQVALPLLKQAAALVQRRASSPASQAHAPAPVVVRREHGCPKASAWWKAR